MLEPQWLLSQLRRLAGQPGRRLRCCVAFSGGLDSTVLLDLLAAARRACPGELRLRALHVDHHLQPAARQFRAQAGRTAGRLRVPLRVLDVAVRARRGGSLEEAARDARYAALRGALEPGELLLTAQHADDQLETLLLALLRGAGPAGLAGMPAAAACGVGLLLRPLLGIDRAELLAHARAQRLEWSEDPSNLAIRFDRNYLRHEVLPALRRRWPAASQTAARSARNCAELVALEKTRVRRDLEAAADGAALEAAVLRRWDVARQGAVLRAWCMRHAVRVPDERRLREALRMLEARADATPLVEWPGARLRLYQGRLILLPGKARGVIDAPVPSAPRRWNWRAEPRLRLARGGVLQLRPDPHGDIDLALLPATLWIHWHAPGRARDSSRSARSLRKLLQELAVPVWERARLPLLAAGADPGSGASPVAIADLWVDPRLQAQPGAPARARIVWREGR